MKIRSLASRLVVGSVLALFALMVPLPQINFSEVSVAATESLPTLEPATTGEVAELQAVAEEDLGDQRVRAVNEKAAEFSLLAVVFDTPPTAPVMVRVTQLDGSWSEWTELQVDTGEGPDDPTNWGTEPFWAGSAGGYELDLAPADATSAQVVLVRNEVQRSVSVAEPVAGAAQSAPFGINPRSAWGARAPRAVSYGTTIRKAVVHHTVSGNGYSQAEVPGILRGIQAYHQDGRGWDDIGYNFVVDRFGSIWEARGGGIDRPVVGAHASGFNTNTVGIAVLGDYSAGRPSSAAVEGVSRVAGWKLFLGGVDPLGSGTYTSAGGPKYPAGTVVNLPNVVGHGDVGSTGCPGRTRELLGAIRQRAQEWADWSRTTSGPMGVLEQLGSTGSTVTATGWAGEFGATDATRVKLTTAGQSTIASAGISRPDVKKAYPSLSDSTGFSVSVANVRPGLQDACITALSSTGASNKSLGCRTVRVGDPTGTSPDGRIETARSGSAGKISIGGWARDPNSTSVSVSLTVDGRTKSSTKSVNGRYSFNLGGVQQGWRRVCIVAKNTGPGQDVRADCRSMSVAGASPIGTFDGYSQKGNLVRVWGWTLDPGAPGLTQVRITYDGRTIKTVRADRWRADIATAYPGEGGEHGYAFEMRMPKGGHTLCATAINRGSGSDTLLGCRSFIVK